MPVGGLPPDLRPMRGVPCPLGAAPLHHVRRALSARGKAALLAGWGGSIGGRNCLHSRIYFPPPQQLPCSGISSSSQPREARPYAQKASLTRPGPGHKVDQTSRFWRVFPSRRRSPWLVGATLPFPPIPHNTWRKDSGKHRDFFGDGFWTAICKRLM